MFRSEVVRRFTFREGLPIIQDLALLVDMAAAGETLVVDPAVAFSYRRHTGACRRRGARSPARPNERRYYRENSTALRPSAGTVPPVPPSSAGHHGCTVSLVPAAVQDRSLPLSTLGARPHR